MHSVSSFDSFKNLRLSCLDLLLYMDIDFIDKHIHINMCMYTYECILFDCS